MKIFNIILISFLCNLASADMFSEFDDCKSSKCEGEYSVNVGGTSHVIDYSCKRKGREVICTAIAQLPFTNPEFNSYFRLTGTQATTYQSLANYSSVEEKFEIKARCTGSGLFACNGQDSEGMQKKREFRQIYRKFRIGQSSRFESLAEGRQSRLSSAERQAESDSVRDRYRNEQAMNAERRQRIINHCGADSSGASAHDVFAPNTESPICLWRNGGSRTIKYKDVPAATPEASPSASEADDVPNGDSGSDE